ncbi:putative RNA-directed DNA polymerase [Tanacetum coccineum]
MADTIFNNSKIFNKKSNNFFCSKIQPTASNAAGLIFDSGANHHLTYTDKDLVNVIDISYLGITVSHPNGTEACITKFGNMVLNKTLTLYDVLVDLRDLKVMGTGSQIDSLYYFDKGIYVVCSLTKGVWHSILGHPYEHVLKVLKNDINLEETKIDFCEICQMAKQTREHFPLSDHKSLVLGELVHLDLWGPYKATSNEGFRFFLTVVDDYTRAFGKSVKIFRSDNGTEFTNKTFETFCANNGIIHQTSCVYTPQQNGIVERKHRHLFNIARSLMFQGGLPLRLWSECILTACYLINRLPSSVLNGDSPYKLVFNKKPNLNHLRVFGCLCYATILTNSDKFSSRSEKCVLVGYSSVKKCYKLYSLEKKQFIFSRDVKFVENVFPFKTMDLDHLNFFNNLDVEIPNTPYDEERVANKSDSDGSNSSQDGSPTFDHQEDAEMPSYGSNGSVTENEMVATPEDTNNSSEGVIGDVQHTEVENNDAQPVRRSKRSSIFPKKI